MSETKKAVDRLRWLCEEAETRAKEELETDFTKHLTGLQREMKQLVPTLFRDGITKFEDSVPFLLEVDRPEESDERYSRASEFKSVALLEPDEGHFHQRMLSATFWVDTVGGLVSTKFFGADEIRQWFCLGMRRWVRFLTAASEKLGTSSTAAAASPQTAKEYSVDEVCRELSRQENGRRTLKRILELSKSGKTPSQISRQNHGKRGYSLPNISEKLKAVRERFPGFLPDEVQ